MAACWLACGLAALGLAPAQAPAVKETVLYNFPANAPLGANPYGGLVGDSAGNLYGTANIGGTARLGVIFKIDATGQKTILYNFPGGANGKNPNGVIRDSAGNLYGTASGGGNLSGCNGFGCGVVFKLDAAGNYKVLYAFTGGADGSVPQVGVTLDEAGNLYGTTESGGPAGGVIGCGVVYMVDPAGNEKVLYTFTCGADGGNPTTNVIRDSAGNLYGTTSRNGVNYVGVVYKVDPAGNEKVLYTFTGGSDGSQPSSGVIRDSAGNLYGTTSGGGAAFNGVVYKLDRANNESVLYNFTGGADGANPNGVIRDPAGNFYGTTQYGGAGSGVVFKVDKAGNETTLYTFTGGTDGKTPQSGVIRSSKGTLYGTTYNGGAANQGVVFRLDTNNRETVLCGFPSPADGGDPSGPLFRDSAGDLYGTTYYGGHADQGTLYKVDAAGHETVLYTFTGGPDGGNPQGNLAADADGNLYGAAVEAGTGASGVVYKLDTAGNQTPLFSFPGFPWPGGAFPLGGVIRDDAGNLYGTTLLGPSNACQYCNGPGVVFKVDPSGNETVLYTFTGGTDGGGPGAGVIRDSEGNLYGTTSGGGSAHLGVVFKLDTAGNETVLHDFTGDFDGANPYTGVIRDSAGNLYGTTSSGGTANMGVVYKVSRAGIETVLYTFTGGADGGQPSSGVVRDKAGNLYGVTLAGGKYNAGVVYMLDPAGHETVLHNFSGGDDGGQPNTDLIAVDGILYGTASLGGTKSGGVVFELKP